MIPRVTGPQTPIEYRTVNGRPIWVKRDDLFTVAGAPGGKARTCWAIATAEPRPPGLITAGARQSPQVNIVARIAHHLGLPCRVHVPDGEDTDETATAAAFGATVVRHRPGYNGVIVARARKDASVSGWRHVPFGMECDEAVIQTAGQVPDHLPVGVTRVVIPIGSGMSAAGILVGLGRTWGPLIPVLGVVVGADPRRRLAAYAPMRPITLVPAGVPYHVHVDARIGDITLDPVYEAKAFRFLEAGDLLWIVGKRPDAARTPITTPRVFQ